MMGWDVRSWGMLGGMGGEDNGCSDLGIVFTVICQTVAIINWTIWGFQEELYLVHSLRLNVNMLLYFWRVW